MEKEGHTKRKKVNNVTKSSTTPSLPLTLLHGEA
jgi:hypothetical protein